MPADIPSSSITERTTERGVAPSSQSSRERASENVERYGIVEYESSGRQVGPERYRTEATPQPRYRARTRESSDIAGVETAAAASERRGTESASTTTVSGERGRAQPVLAEVEELGVPNADLLVDQRGINAFWNRLREMQAAREEARHLAELAEHEANLRVQREARERQANRNDIAVVNRDVIEPLNNIIQQVAPDAEPIPQVEQPVTRSALATVAEMGVNTYKTIASVTQYAASAAATTAVAVGRTTPAVLKAAVKGVKATASGVGTVAGLAADAVKATTSAVQETRKEYKRRRAISAEKQRQKQMKIAEEERQKAIKRARERIEQSNLNAREMADDIQQVTRRPNPIARARQELERMPEITYNAAAAAERHTAEQIRANNQRAIQLVLYSSPEAEEAIDDIAEEVRQPSPPRPTQRARSRSRTRYGSPLPSRIEAERRMEQTRFADLPEDIRMMIENAAVPAIASQQAAQTRRTNARRRSGIDEANILQGPRTRTRTRVSEFGPSSGMMGGPLNAPSGRKSGRGKPCWEGYEMIGMKQKGNKEVPNCVPMKGGVQSDYAGPIPKQIKEQKKRAAPTGPRKPRLPKESREGFDDDKNEMYGEWDNNLGNLKENDLMQTETQEVRYHKDFKGLEKRLGLEKRAKKLKSKGWINEPSKPIG